MSVDIVTGTAAVTGFTHSDRNHGDHGGYSHRGYDFNDIFHGSRLADGFHGIAADIRDGDRGTELAVEKTAAANILAIEKVAAAHALAIERTTNENHLAIIQAENRLAMNQADTRAEMAKCCCEIKELVRSEACTTREVMRGIDADNARVALANATAELLALKYQADKK